MQNISVFSEEMQKIILVFSYFYSKALVIIRNTCPKAQEQHPYDVLLGELATDDNTTSSLGRVMIFRRSYQIRFEPSKCFCV